MSEIIPRLRPGLDFMASPVPEHPGLLIRDPMGYSSSVLIVPGGWAHALSLFDGRHTVLDCQAFLTQLSGEITLSDDIRKFIDVLQTNGFLATPEYDSMKRAREDEFRTAGTREPAHAGTAYPLEPAALNKRFREFFSVPADGAAAANGLATTNANAIGIAAPHVSPEGGFRTYAAAYRALPQGLADRTLVLLGTSHYGCPNRFGLTRKVFRTPLGTLPVDEQAVEFLLSRAGESCLEEDYCHAIEHSIEFQCVFTQFMTGANPKILPILCGPILHDDGSGDNPEVARFIDALGELAAQRGNELFWILGIDLAHIGRRYGDEIDAKAGEGHMLGVAEQDRLRLQRVEAGDAGGLREVIVSPAADELKWCGYSPLYTFLRAVPDARAERLGYEQWNIDPVSVVSFTALRLTRRAD